MVQGSLNTGRSCTPSRTYSHHKPKPTHQPNPNHPQVKPKMMRKRRKKRVRKAHEKKKKLLYFSHFYQIFISSIYFLYISSVYYGFLLYFFCLLSISSIFLLLISSYIKVKIQVQVNRTSISPLTRPTSNMWKNSGSACFQFCPLPAGHFTAKVA